MSSDEIDSTTTATTVAAIYQHDDAAAALAFNSLESEDQADHFRVNDMLTSSASTNGQKRKLSQDAFPGDEHSNVDELKKQRTNESDPVASTIENPSHSPPHAGENANSSGNEATGAVVVSVPVNEIVVKQEVKDEPQDDNEAASGEAQSTSGLNGNISVKREFKVEPKVEIVTTEEATSSIRDSCQFGIRCYSPYQFNRSQERIYFKFIQEHQFFKIVNQTLNSCDYYQRKWCDLRDNLNNLGPPYHNVKEWQNIWQNHLKRSRLKRAACGEITLQTFAVENKENSIKLTKKKKRTNTFILTSQKVEMGIQSQKKEGKVLVKNELIKPYEKENILKGNLQKKSTDNKDTKPGYQSKQAKITQLNILNNTENNDTLINSANLCQIDKTIAVEKNQVPCNINNNLFETVKQQQLFNQEKGYLDIQVTLADRHLSENERSENLKSLNPVKNESSDAIVRKRLLICIKKLFKIEDPHIGRNKNDDKYLDPIVPTLNVINSNSVLKFESRMESCSPLPINVVKNQSNIDKNQHFHCHSNVNIPNVDKTTRKIDDFQIITSSSSGLGCVQTSPLNTTQTYYERTDLMKFDDQKDKIIKKLSAENVALKNEIQSIKRRTMELCEIFRKNYFDLQTKNKARSTAHLVH